MLIQIDAKAQRIREAQAHQRFLDDFYKEITTGWELQKQIYREKRAAEIGRENQGAAGWIEGLGQLEAQYDADLWYHAYFKDRYHWSDDETVKQYAKDNPEVVVKS